MNSHSRLILQALMLFIIVAVSGCTVKSDQQIVDDLWAVWEKSEQLAQVNYPEAVPLVLVHGWNGGETTWPVPERLIKLEELLRRDIYLFTYRTGIFANRYPPLEVLEEQLDRYLAPYAQVDIVAHSMGGLLVRQYLAHHQEHAVRRVLFLATPHFGTNAAQVLVQLGSVRPAGNIQATEIQPGSDFLWQLNALEGAEFDGVEVLNLYAADSSLLKTDLVVPPSSAYLPWAHNAMMQGDHHTLAENFDSYTEVLGFLNEGLLPAAEPVPARRDAWLRFKLLGNTARLSEANFKSYGRRGLPNKEYTLCCELRSGLYSKAGYYTVVIQDIEPGNNYAFMPYGGREPLLLTAESLMQSTKQPVLMQIMDLDAKAVESTKEVETEPQSEVGIP